MQLRDGLGVERLAGAIRTTARRPPWQPLEMNAQATKLQAAENDLKQLMANVTRAIEKAQQAVWRIAPKAAATTTDTESTDPYKGAGRSDGRLRLFTSDAPPCPFC